MPFAEILKGYLLGGLNQNSGKVEHIQNNEVLFCKNNVCVHPPAALRHPNEVLHNAGYLTVTTKVFIDQYNDCERPTLFLTWIPNSDLSKGAHELKRHSSLESVNSSDSNNSNERDLTPEKIGRPVTIELKSTNPFLNHCEESKYPDGSVSSSEDGDRSCLTVNVNISKPEIEIVQTPDCVREEHIERFSRSSSVISVDSTSLFNIVTPEYLMQKHNLTFPNSVNSSPILPNKHLSVKMKCRRFSVDLSQMRSLRLFFSDESCTSGQLVVASRESQYKILHFHHGGLDRLAHVLHQWHSLLHNIKNAKGGDENLPFRHFMVCRPEVSQLELHPEEGNVPKLTDHNFRCLLNDVGQIEDDLALRKMVFFSGMDRDIRREVWPFLLQVYPFQSTAEERIHIANIRRLEYEEITRRRLNLNENDLRQFKRKIQSVVEKDVVRTDRGNPFFSGDDNPNLTIMKNILLNYAIYNPNLGYTQGMSDLLAPVLCELKDEVAAFWCFVGLMQRALFVATPTDRDMDRCLRYLRELIRLMVPKFYQHLKKYKDATELLFCHRWILLCFKREFTEAVALRMWEACWANYLTDYFHLFLCLAIVFVYADDVVAQDLNADEMLLHFSSLAMYMDGQLIAKKARGLLHQFRQIREIPCSLNGLCAKCGPGQWDSAHSPRIHCTCSGPCKNN